MCTNISYDKLYTVGDGFDCFVRSDKERTCRVSAMFWTCITFDGV